MNERFLGFPNEITVPVIGINYHSQGTRTIGFGLIDTGATITHIDKKLAERELFLVRTNHIVEIQQPGVDKINKSEACSYVVRIRIGNIEKDLLAVGLSKLDYREEIKFIIGMDFLKHFNFQYLPLDVESLFVISDNS